MVHCYHIWSGVEGTLVMLLRRAAWILLEKSLKNTSKFSGYIEG